MINRETQTDALGLLVVAVRPLITVQEWSNHGTNGTDIVIHMKEAKNFVVAGTTAQRHEFVTANGVLNTGAAIKGQRNTIHHNGGSTGSNHGFFFFRRRRRCHRRFRYRGEFCIFFGSIIHHQIGRSGDGRRRVGGRIFDGAQIWLRRLLAIHHGQFGGFFSRARGMAIATAFTGSWRCTSPHHGHFGRFGTHAIVHGYFYIFLLDCWRCCAKEPNCVLWDDHH
mmetsp:Transcript_21330/g.44513  ORF Transcript_21330/g.44513 Transcript_21330/m.44513 type:complete len:224 (+) Transcript_21330:189-860(+)